MGEVFGVFCCEHIGPPREWSTEERDFVASVADQIAIKHRAAQVHRLRRTLEVQGNQLMALEKSDALAKLALGIGHDFRNVLASIINSVHVLKIAADLPQHLTEPLTIIEEAATTGTRLITELMDYGRNRSRQTRSSQPSHRNR